MSGYPAPGKLNLFLHVLGRRDDGYHLLQTVFRLIDYADQVSIEPREDGLIRRTTEFAGVDQEADLCIRAARLLKQNAIEGSGSSMERLGADIGLVKRLPMGGGLGGGSSDAATVLIVLNKLWGLGFNRDELMAMAVRLGADVPAFVFGENALGEGIGERLLALPLRPAWYLVLVPQVSVSTKEIFSSPALTRDTKPLKIPPFLPGLGTNDLQPIATVLYPEIAAHLDWLSKHGDARMTGSGACVFAEFGSEAHAQAVHAQMPRTLRGFVARGLDRHPLREWVPDA